VITARGAEGMKLRKKQGEIKDFNRKAVIKKGIPYRSIHCALFAHIKDSRVCTVLRAKGVCKKDCPDYMEFAKNNKEAIDSTIEQYKKIIQLHHAKYELDWSTVDNAYPKGEFICEHCGKTYRDEGRLKSHYNKKHRKFIERINLAKLKRKRK
jgi:hypothetical protein